jgi:hypothetical protein
MICFFKDYDIFQNHPDEICYVPENAEDDDDGFSRNDFIDLCNGDELKAEIIFDLCEWEFPSTILDQWDEEDDEALEELRALIGTE